MKKTTFLIVGKHAVLEALKNPSRKIERVFLTEDAQKKLNRENQSLNLFKSTNVFYKSRKELDIFSNDNIKNKIIITDEITPKDIIDIHHSKGLGVITSHGSRSSHSAILSKSLALPMLVKVESSINIIKNGDKLIMDPENQIIIVNPDEIELKHFKKIQLENNSLIKSFKKTTNKKAVTKDRIKIDVMCNLELSEEVKLLNDSSDGVGLFRTEYLYMNRDDLPTEQEQYQAYRKVFKKVNNKPVTLRTLDIGSDKEVSENIKVGQIAKNPALGLRGIRYSLYEKNLFKVQIKAMLRAAKNGKLRILIPMITTLDEINQAKELIDDAKVELIKEKQSFMDRLGDKVADWGLDSLWEKHMNPDDRFSFNKLHQMSGVAKEWIKRNNEYNRSKLFTERLKDQLNDFAGKYGMLVKESRSRAAGPGSYQPMLDDHILDSLELAVINCEILNRIEQSRENAKDQL